MRQEVGYILLGHALVVLFLVYQTFDLITLLYDDTFQDSITQLEIDNPGPALIPKIIHQTYKTSDIPEIWKEGQQRCIDLHPDYQYILWTDEMAHNFIAENYPWFLSTYDGYKYPIERADAIRYFVLNHFGGIYIDLDDGCARRLDPLLQYSAFVRKTVPTGVSNDVMGSVPRHPFFLKVIQSLESYDHNWLVPYITIMYSTGPLFLSVLWKRYKRWGVPDSFKIKIIMPEEYKKGADAFFTIAPGSSWHMDDAKFLMTLARHLTLAVIGGCLIAALLLYLEYLFYCLVISSAFKKMLNFILKTITFGKMGQQQYTPIQTQERGNIEESYPRRLMKTRNRKDSNLPVVVDLEKQETV
ncbi:unnamed protein product [Kuraishia capsulata CBS 1993]|uniref:inositol phosphorylceramide mannosyltransferase n=1 Tax=Kuraishia capsulata CBS 1993 TaxID=1382522 RepID=W6MPF3_9ASCO|nr:uncharacterized protein KUCA_T00004185001 [Kuraishia capsulata CBS 1993]CDK28203.1 unnamed protein product [Kuraishia capsulata CBS 1993]